MKKQRAIGFVVVFLILAGLIFLQVRTWKSFDWGKFSQQVVGLKWWLVLAGAGMIYLADAIRAVRWAIFLKPVCKVNPVQLVAPQFIGFTGLALLGRPGELMRPYIIARKLSLTFSSQLAVWTVERIFDAGAVAMILTLSLIFSDTLRNLPFGTIHIRHHPIPITAGSWAIVLMGLVGMLVIIAAIIRYRSVELAGWFERRLGARFPHVAHKASHKILAFGEGLNTIHDLRSFASLSLLSIVIWLLCGAAYYLVTHAYASPQLQSLSFGKAVLLMSASLAGGVLQLPVVGGGSQLATISVLVNVFNVVTDPATCQYAHNCPELATSCGIMLWLITFMAVSPIGIALAHREHLSLRKLEEESQPAEEVV